MHVENGQIYETRIDKDGKSNKTLLTKSFVDWIDYWAVDFDYEKIIYVEKGTVLLKNNGQDNIF